jgi:hypothetical protein
MYGTTNIKYFIFLFLNLKGGNLVSRTPLDRTQVIRFHNYPDRLGPSVKFGENSTILTYFEVTGYQIKYSTVLWHLELQIRRGRKVQTQVHTANSNSRTANCHCSLFPKKNPIIQIFSLSGCLSGPVIPDKWSSTVSQARLLATSFLWGIM